MDTSSYGPWPLVQKNQVEADGGRVEVGPRDEADGDRVEVDPPDEADGDRVEVDPPDEADGDRVAQFANSDTNWDAQFAISHSSWWRNLPTLIPDGYDVTEEDELFLQFWREWRDQWNDCPEFCTLCHIEKASRYCIGYANRGCCPKPFFCVTQLDYLCIFEKRENNT